MKHIWTALEGVGDAVAAEQAVPRIPGQSLLHPDVRIYGIQFHSLDCKGYEAISLRGPSSENYRIVKLQDAANYNLQKFHFPKSDRKEVALSWNYIFIAP